MTLQKINALLLTINFMIELRQHMSKNSVAKNVKYCSRATAYRHIDILIKLNMLSVEFNLILQVDEVSITKAGMDFLHNYPKLV